MIRFLILLVLISVALVLGGLSGAFLAYYEQRPDLIFDDVPAPDPLVSPELPELPAVEPPVVETAPSGVAPSVASTSPSPAIPSPIASPSTASSTHTGIAPTTSAPAGKPAIVPSPRQSLARPAVAFSPLPASLPAELALLQPQSIPPEVAKAKSLPKRTPAAQPARQLKVGSQNAILMDLKTREILFAKEPHEIRYPASTTKIVTALVVLEDGPLDVEVTAAQSDLDGEPSWLPVDPGEKITRLQMLYALMLKSGNDVAEALAREVAGSREGFAARMNERARQAGALNSHFNNPNGLPDKAHTTTVYDMALLSAEAMQYPIFRHIVATPAFAWRSRKAQYVMDNHNYLLKGNLYPGVNGVKTGWTIASGNTYVGSSSRGGEEMLVVFFKSDKNTIIADSKNLFNYGFKLRGVEGVDDPVYSD